MEHQLLKSIASKFVQFAFIFALFTINMSAQGSDFDTKGKEFYLSFPPNYHDDFDYNYETDSIYVYIAAEKPTNVSIEFTNILGQKDIQNIIITDPSKFYTFARYFKYYELLGDYNNILSLPRSAEKVQKQGLRITSDQEINVYGLSASTRSSDAFLVFPIDVIGTEYYVMSYSSDQNNGDPFNHNSPNKYTPSQFVVTATMDNTIVYVTPSCKTSKNHTNMFSVNLNQGESFVVQADKDTDSPASSDLTGSYIKSNNPIALFGGHQRSALPYEINPIYSDASRDVLVDQVPPITTWGKNAFVIPFPKLDSINIIYSDKYRVLSSTDNNKIKINSTEITLNKGKFFEGSITDFPISITAQDPILVAQFKKSSKLDSNDKIRNSDPLMIVIPPKEQFIQKAKLFNMQKIENNTDVFTSQYIIVVAPDTAIGKCKIDNSTLLPTYFNKIPNSEYSYYLYTTESGVHNFESNAKCGLYVIGYGYANSYGYVGGMELKNIRDTLPPEIQTARECYRLVGTIIDDLHDTEGLQEITVVQNLIRNVTINLPTDYIGKSRAEFSIELKDRTKDGIYAIKVIDKQKNEMLLIDTIQGNTLVSNVVDGVDNEFGTVSIANEKCKYIQFENKGLLPYKFNQIRLNSGFYYSIPPSQLPFVVAPGEKKDLMVCFNTDKYSKSQLTDSIMLYMPCYSLIVPLKGKSEVLSQAIDTKCGMQIKLTLSSIVSELILEDITINKMANTAKIIFGIPKQSKSKIVVSDVLGNEKQVLLDDEVPSGLYEMEFSYENYESGLYFINLVNTDGIITRKLILNR